MRQGEEDIVGDGRGDGALVGDLAEGGFEVDEVRGDFVWVCARTDAQGAVGHGDAKRLELAEEGRRGLVGGRHPPGRGLVSGQEWRSASIDAAVRRLI